MNSFKKLISALLIAIILIPTGTFAYDDVDGNSTYFYGVNYLRRNGVFPDVETLNAKKIVSRAEFVSYLVKLFEPNFVPQGSANTPFSDVRANAWYATYIAEAIELGMLDETIKTFRPDDPIRVIEATQILFQANSIPLPRKHVGPVPYNDVRGTEHEALIMRAIQLDVVDPVKSDYVGVINPLNREQVALMIYRMEKLNLVPGQTQQVNVSDWDYGLQKIVSSWDLLNRTYVDPESLDQEKLSDAAIAAMVDSVGDPYSTYLDKTATKSFVDDTEGEIEGIGAYLELNENGEAVIISPIPGSPAEAAGVKPGDIIVSVDGIAVKGFTIEHIAEAIKGPRGTTVNITFRRNGQEIKLTVKRDLVIIRSVDYKVINNNIALITLRSFNLTVADQLQAVANQINEDDRIKGVILDLRNNPGGLLDISIKVMSFFINDRVPAVKIKENLYEITHNTNGNGDLSHLPLAILINGSSASASEIVAGALKEYGVATVVGSISFGKGSVQQINYFTDDSSIKITIAKWFTPEGLSIQGNGVTPNVQVEDDPNTARDEVVDSAVRELNKKIR